MLFKQIKRHGDNFSYIIADEISCEAIVVDTSYNFHEIFRILKENAISLKYVISTHGHSDHTVGNSELKAALGGKIVVHRLSRGYADIKVGEGDVLEIGKIRIRVIHTPGHSPDGICLLVNGTRLLTGDTLFVGECGRTDLPGGNARSLYNSLFNKLLKLDGDVQVYPGHDYGPIPTSTIGEERKTNYVLQPRSVEEFILFMNEP